MDHIVATIHPFVIEQDVAVYKNGECIKAIKCSLDEVENVCYNLCKEYDIHQLDLGGNQLYTMHLKDKIIENKFDNFNINVEVH